jgi:hypothetical protein
MNHAEAARRMWADPTYRQRQREARMGNRARAKRVASPAYAHGDPCPHCQGFLVRRARKQQSDVAFCGRCEAIYALKEAGDAAPAR